MITFPDELAAFRARTADPGYRALILLGTRQATTAALLLGTLRVERVAFLLTDETLSMPQDVAALLSCSADAWLCPAGDHSTPLAVYTGLRQVLEQWNDLDRADIAVDVTGGLKPMSMGLEKAAYILQLPTIYVQSEYEKQPDGRSVVVPGTQRLEMPLDPYAVFGDLEAAEAHRLYQQHDYPGAQRIFADLARRVPSADGERYGMLATLSAMYAAWDALDFAAAARQADALRFAPLALVFPRDAQRVVFMHHQAVLPMLVMVSASVSGTSADEKLRTLADPYALLPLLGTLHAAALRRATQGRYDFAALFRYRCLELISQHRLATYGIFTNGPHFDALGAAKAQVNERFMAQQRLAGRTAVRGLGKLRSIAMFDGYMLLAALEDPLVRAYPVTRIEERSRARNQSVLAHGYRLIDRDEYAQFAEVVDEVIDQLFRNVLNQPRADWEHRVQFINLL